MTRFFYTDALEAAYMTKHHRFEIIVPWLNGKEYVNGKSLMWESIARGPWASKYFIHPDSLHLLEPQDGDAVEFDRWHWDRQRHEDMKNIKPQPHFARVRIEKDWKHISSAGIGWDMAKLHEPFSLPFKIIQRAGRPFFYPQSA